MIKSPGRQATKSQQFLLAGLIKKRSESEIVIIHHITEDSTKRLQLEIERRCGVNGISFERVIL